MNNLDLIGKVSVEWLHTNVEGSNLEGCSRFLLDRLTGEQVYHICLAISSDEKLKDKVSIKIPKILVPQFKLPEDFLTDEKTTFWRNAPCAKAILLLANTNDDQAQSLKEITAVGAKELKRNANLWVKIASQDLDLGSEDIKHWEKALEGLLKVHEFSLDQFSQYISNTRKRINEEGEPLKCALGWALPSLRIPRDSGYFVAITKPGQVAQWKSLYQQARNKRSCYLLKQTPTRQTIEEQDLKKSYKKAKPVIPEHCHTVIEEFIKSKPGWNQQSLNISELEWEIDSVNLVFLGIKTKKANLATETIHFFEYEFPESLTEDEKIYLDTLQGRNTIEPNDEDIEFYEDHRQELNNEKKLKSKWDRFIYGKPIECDDFLIGSIQCVERLLEQSGYPAGNRQLRISTQKGEAPNRWLELNTDVGLSFCMRYRGLPLLTNPLVKWETHWLFKYDQLIAHEQEQKKAKYQKNTSTARTALNIEFYFELKYKNESGDEESNKVQLVWKGNPNSISMRLFDDINALLENNKCFRYLQVNNDPINKKGRLQNISLADVATFEAINDLDRGALVGPYTTENDLLSRFEDALEVARINQQVSTEGHQRIRHKWDLFKDAYGKALKNMFDGDGYADNSPIVQAERFNELLKTLHADAQGDSNRVNLWQPVILIGCAAINDGKYPKTIITPWHPMRILASTMQVRQFTDLIKTLTESEQLSFGDARLFFLEWCDNLRHSYYPEVCVGYDSVQPVLLSISDSVDGYLLMENLSNNENNESNENPYKAALKLKEIVLKYLELQPHEQANMSIVLHNCDSTGLPLAVIGSLSTLYDGEDEVRCQIILRHDNMNRLNELYEELVNDSSIDPDSLVISQMSKDFMARLRIEIMADQGPVKEPKKDRSTDIVFVQDAVSKLSKIVWLKTDKGTCPDIADHFPARWSRKIATSNDELKSTTLLVCPRHPEIGWSYLESVRCLTEMAQPSNSAYLPARQVSFEDKKAKGIFVDLHRLSEWVVNYDDILERRLLKNQGVKIIKYQQSRSTGRNLIISTQSSLDLLNVLVRKRIKELNLGYDDIIIESIAERFINDANLISGDIVLRAARRGIFANELMGVALSKILIESEFKDNERIAWFFLDDYADWLGQKEQQIADIMALSPRVVNGYKYLQVIISEAKYVKATSVAEAKKKSKKQLRDTISRMYNALLNNSKCLDRNLWLAKLADMLIDGVDADRVFAEELESWRDGIRSGNIPIHLKGYSHVFVSGPNDTALSDEQIVIDKEQKCYQEVFSRDLLRKLVKSYYNNENIVEIRQQCGDMTFWMTEFEMSTDTVPPEKNDAQSTLTIDIPKLDIGEEELEHEQLWAKPKLNNWILKRHYSNQNSDEDTIWLEETSKKLRGALLGYQLQAKILDKRLTPNSAIFFFMGSDNLKVEDVEKKRMELLTTHGLNIVNVTPLPGQILISIARAKRQTITLPNVWCKRILNQDSVGINSALVIGVKEIDGKLLYLNVGESFDDCLQHAPHTLIAGTTGSGKSILLQNMILDLCATNSPDLAHIYLIDPKAGVDYLMLEDLPHIQRGIIINQNDARTILEDLVNEMDRRYLLFKENKANNLGTYNKKSEMKLPVIWVFHDEFAEWMLTEDYKNAVSSVVQRLGVKARAAGIHLVFAAQRPDANVLPVQLRENLGNRLILRVESTGTSEISLGQKGAERLLGKGHLVARLPGESNLIYAQVPFIAEDDLDQLITAIQDDWK